MRRSRAIVVLAAAALMAAAPAFAQRASLADRVTALEQAAANNQGNVDLLNQVQQLRSEVQSLRAQLEELQQQNEQLKQTNRNQYLDLDGRLTRLESGGATTPATGATTMPARPATSTRPASVAAERPPTVRGDAGLTANAADERTAYNAAFDVLKAGDYVQSAQQFQQFLTDYPAGTYAPNALYWLGESYYVTQNYPLAIQAFDTVLQRFPDSSKSPDAMLKKGYSLIELGQGGQGAATLNAVINEFPGTEAARLANTRLRTLSLQTR